MDESLLSFTAALASSAPTPGGGGAAALMGALAASLGTMASRISAGRKTDPERAERLAVSAERCEALRLRFLEQIEADAAVFRPLSAAYKLPKDAPGREETLRAASLMACSAALELLRLCRKSAELLSALLQDVGALLLSDVGCAAAACRAAVLSAAYNVYINTRPYPEDPEAQGLNRLTESLLQESLETLEGIELRVLMDLRNEEI